MKTAQAVRSYYVLPCCLLLLNLCIGVVGYKARIIADPLERTAAIMGMVLFGGSLVAFVVAPAIEALVRALHVGSRRGAGTLGEILFLALLGVGVFWLYYQFYIVGPEAILPAAWHNPRFAR